jgi:hypothetical protein
MYSHGPHMDVTDLELSPILEIWSGHLRDLEQNLDGFGLVKQDFSVVFRTAQVTL